MTIGGYQSTVVFSNFSCVESNNITVPFQSNNVKVFLYSGSSQVDLNMDLIKAVQ